jgi:hypothetical protein
MSKEHNHNPDWANRERREDLAWIRENADIFHLAAQIAYPEAGRGVIVVDTTIQPLPDGGHAFGYFDQAFVDEALDEDTQRMVQEYDPEEEVILVLLKEQERTSTYRFRTQPAGKPGGDAQPPHRLRPLHPGTAGSPQPPRRRLAASGFPPFSPGARSPS